MSDFGMSGIQGIAQLFEVFLHPQKHTDIEAQGREVIVQWAKLNHRIHFFQDLDRPKLLENIDSLSQLDPSEIV